jgi:hypothetical protein
MRPWDGEPPPKYHLADLARVDLPSADVALCLSLVMYTFPDPGWALLQRVSHAAPVMFLDYGGRYAGHLPFTPWTIGDEIVRHSAYTEWRQLGNTELQYRPFYVFRR